MVTTRVSRKFNRCVKSVKRTVRARKGSNKESAAIAICTKSVLHKRGRTMKRYSRGRLSTQKKLRGGALGAPKSKMGALFASPASSASVQYAPAGSPLTPGQFAAENAAKKRADSDRTAAIQRSSDDAKAAWSKRRDTYEKEREEWHINRTDPEQYRDKVNADVAEWEKKNPKPSGGRRRRRA
jgi:hypothetical protein